MRERKYFSSNCIIELANKCLMEISLVSPVISVGKKKNRDQRI